MAVSTPGAVDLFQVAGDISDGINKKEHISYIKK